MAENQGKVPSLLCLPAYDPDKGSHANTIYSITSGNDAGLFSIDPALGLLSVDQGLDYEHQSIHKLVIKATDGGGRPDGLASVNVIVHVQDVNDAPVFLRNIHEGIAIMRMKLEMSVIVIRPAGHDANNFSEFAPSDRRTFCQFFLLLGKFSHFYIFFIVKTAWEW